MKKNILLLLMMLSLSGCSGVGLLKGAVSSLTPSNGISAEVTVAEEVNEQIVIGNQKEQEIEGENVEVFNTETITNISETSPLLLILLVMGWLLPSPSEIWRGLLNSINFLIRGKRD